MKIRIIGGGPAGLYFAALMKRLRPTSDIAIYERGPRGATWGFGVVFSDRALEFLRADDEELYRHLTPHMETWHDLKIVHNETAIPIAGNGFAAVGRLQLLALLHQFAEKQGVRIHFESDVNTLGDPDLADADLIVAANGASSWIRAENEKRLGTRAVLHPNKFIWYGTTKPFECLTLTFRETPLGVFCAHHYRYSPTMSTFLVEVQSDTWARAGFEKMNPDDTLRHCESVFARDLEGQRIVSNNSYWRNFPAIWNERWSFDNVVFLGDALRTAHFSIGSGTRLAMEDAVALAKCFQEHGDDVRAALDHFQRLRLPPMKKIWDAANVSLRWYENMDELVRRLNPVEFAYSYMTRTGRVDHAEVKRRDARLAAEYEQLHPEVIATT